MQIPRISWLLAIPIVLLLFAIMMVTIAGTDFIPTDITVEQFADHVEIESSTGDDDDILGVTAARAGVMLPADKVRLDNLQIQAFVAGGARFRGAAVAGDDYLPGDHATLDNKLYMFVGSATSTNQALDDIRNRQNWAELGGYVSVLAGVNYRIAWKAAPDGTRCGNHSPPVTFSASDFTGSQAVESGSVNVLTPNSNQAQQVCIGIWRSDAAGGDPSSVDISGTEQRYGFGSAAALTVDGVAGQAIVSTWAISSTWVTTSTFTID